MPSIFGTKEEILAQIEGFKMMNAWTEANPVELSPEDALRAVSDLYSFLPPETRAHRDDPMHEGVRFMNETLGKLRG
jgi:hypothetical protein